MPNDTIIKSGRCHCGAVKLEAMLAGGFKSILRCNCSFCRMRGAVVAMAEAGGIRILEGEVALTTYRFHTGAAQHFFFLPPHKNGEGSLDVGCAEVGRDDAAVLGHHVRRPVGDHRAGV